MEIVRWHSFFLTTPVDVFTRITGLKTDCSVRRMAFSQAIVVISGMMYTVYIQGDPKVSAHPITYNNSETTVSNP